MQKMIKEEKSEHDNDISNRFIPRLLEPGISGKLDKLSIQDLIVIQKDAKYALDKKIFHMNEDQSLKFGEVIEQIQSMIANKVKKADKLYVIIDKATRMPYLDNDASILVFSEEEFANEALDYFTQQMRTWDIREISKENIISTLGCYFYMNGALGIVVDNGQTPIHILSEDLIEAPDFSDTRPENIPVVNPDFLRVLTMLEQERCWKVTYEGKASRLRFFEDHMIWTFVNARFLVPAKGMSNLSKGGKIIIPSLSNGKDNATPVFTDWNQFNKVYSQKEWDGGVWTAKDLLHAPDDVIVINAGEIRFAMDKKMIAQILKVYEKEILPFAKED